MNGNVSFGGFVMPKVSWIVIDPLLHLCDNVELLEIALTLPVMCIHVHHSTRCIQLLLPRILCSLVLICSHSFSENVCGPLISWSFKVWSELYYWLSHQANTTANCKEIGSCSWHFICWWLVEWRTIYCMMSVGLYFEIARICKDS